MKPLLNIEEHTSESLPHEPVITVENWKNDYSHMVGGVPFYPINKVENLIDQTREETIREMELEIENWEIVDGKSFTSDKIKDILNKLKK